MDEPREMDDRRPWREPLEGRRMTDETGRRMRGVRDERGADGVRDDIGEALE
jgi:hypothetical protein